MDAAPADVPVTPLDADRRARLWTPERVPLTVPLAGLGERALAYAVDLGIVAGVLLAVGFIYNFWGDLERDLGSLSGIGLIVLALGLFVFAAGYDVVFEVLGDGRTPGKRLSRLRVVTGSGGRPDLLTSVLRNGMRMLDILPVAYGVGTVTLFITGTRRLGDLVADTFVVTERARTGDALGRCQTLAGAVRSGQPPGWSDAQVLAALTALERGAHLDDGPAEATARKALRHIDKDRAKGTKKRQDARARLAVGVLAMSETRAGIAAQLRRARDAELELRARLQGIRKGAGIGAVEQLDIAIRHAGSELMRSTRRGVPARTLEALSLSLLDAERRRGASEPVSASLATFFSESIPRALYAERGQVFRAAAVLTIGVLLGGALGYADADIGRALVGDELAVMIERGADWTSRIEKQGTFGRAALYIIMNNTRIGVVAFALGLLGGVGSLLILSLNGLHLGAVIGYALSIGTANTLLKFILAHGPVELAAISVAGAAGLVLGRAITAPGRRTRLEALREEGAVGARMLVGALLGFVVIGTVEGFVSPGAMFPWYLNALVGVLTFALFVAWVRVRGGRVAILPAAIDAPTL